MFLTCTCDVLVEGYTSEQIEAEWLAHRRAMKAGAARGPVRSAPKWSIGRSAKLYESFGFDR